MARKPCERGEVAQPGTAFSSGQVVNSSVFGPGRDDDELSCSKEPLLDGEGRDGQERRLDSGGSEGIGVRGER